MGRVRRVLSCHRLLVRLESREVRVLHHELTGREIAGFDI